MRQLVLIIIISLLYCNFSYCTIVNITAPDYKNQTLSWKRKIDYITNSFEKIDHTTIDSNGYGKLNYDFKQIELTEISIGRSHGLIYIDTATNQYNIYFPKDTIIDQASLKKSEIQLVFLNLKENDINNLILDFNYELDFFLYGDTSKIVRMVRHDKEFQEALNNFKIYLSNRYKDKMIKYLHNYIRYEIAVLEQLANQSKGEFYKAYLYENYINNKELNYSNDAYMQFFNQFYKDVFKIGGSQLNKEILLAINNNNFEELNDMIKNSKYFSSDQISEFAIIKGLFDSYSLSQYSPQNILLFLDNISKKSKWKSHRELANNCIIELTKFSIGAICPKITVIDKKNNIIKVDQLKKNYTYINFFASWNYKSLKEMEIIKKFNENYSFINFISINLDNNKADFEKFLANNSNYKWQILYPKNKQELISEFHIDDLPTHLLIDPKGLISQYPALPPSPLSKGYQSSTIDETFFNIKKKNKVEEKMNIGRKNY